MRIEDTPHSRIVLCDDGIIEAMPAVLEVRRGSELMTAGLDAISQLAGTQRRPVLWKPSGTLPLRPEGWQVIVARLEQTVSALAMVVDVEEEPLLGAFPTAIDSLLIPAQVFHDAVEAREWLLPFVDPGEPST